MVAVGAGDCRAEEALGDLGGQRVVNFHFLAWDVLQVRQGRRPKRHLRDGFEVVEELLAAAVLVDLDLRGVQGAQCLGLCQQLRGQRGDLPAAQGVADGGNLSGLLRGQDLGSAVRPQELRKTEHHRLVARDSCLSAGTPHGCLELALVAHADVIHGPLAVAAGTQGEPLHEVLGQLGQGLLSGGPSHTRGNLDGLVGGCVQHEVALHEGLDVGLPLLLGGIRVAGQERTQLRGGVALKGLVVVGASAASQHPGPPARPLHALACGGDQLGELWCFGESLGTGLGLLSHALIGGGVGGVLVGAVCHPGGVGLQHMLCVLVEVGVPVGRVTRERLVDLRCCLEGGVGGLSRLQVGVQGLEQVDELGDRHAGLQRGLQVRDVRCSHGEALRVVVRDGLLHGSHSGPRLCLQDLLLVVVV